MFVVFVVIWYYGDRTKNIMFVMFIVCTKLLLKIYLFVLIIKYYKGMIKNIMFMGYTKIWLKYIYL
jgi:hypothetical protein